MLLLMLLMLVLLMLLFDCDDWKCLVNFVGGNYLEPFSHSLFLNRPATTHFWVVGAYFTLASNNLPFLAAQAKYKTELIWYRKKLHFTDFIQSVSPIYTWEARWLSSSQFWPLLMWVLFLEAAGEVAKIGSSLKPNHHYKFYPAQIGETLCRKTIKENVLF